MDVGVSDGDGGIYVIDGSVVEVDGMVVGLGAGWLDGEQAESPASSESSIVIRIIA